MYMSTRSSSLTVLKIFLTLAGVFLDLLGTMTVVLKFSTVMVYLVLEFLLIEMKLTYHNNIIMVTQ